MKLLFATGNDFKFNLMQERLKPLSDIELVSPKMLGVNIDVKEDGITAEENAILKAKAYHELTNMPTVAEDSGLYIDKFRKDEQPGLFVKRVNGQEGLSDEEVLKYYIDKLKEHEGRSLAHYYSGLCVINENGEMCSDTVEEEEFLLTVNKCKRVNMKGSILNCISYDLDAEKYFDERTLEESKAHYRTLDERYREIIGNALLKGRRR
jgi:non-canonical purine NTP pyrophosphatase (RdgB/HAM1 family)